MGKNQNTFLIIIIAILIVGILLLSALFVGGRKKDDIPLPEPQPDDPGDVPDVDVPDNVDVIPPDVPAGQCIKAGHFEEVWIKTHYSTGDNPITQPVSVARFVSDSVCEQEFLIESGIIESSFNPLVVFSNINLPMQKKAVVSACDNSEHYASVAVTLQPRQAVNVWFYPKFYRDNWNVPKQGFYDVYVNAYTGCMTGGNPNNNEAIAGVQVNVRYSDALPIYTADSYHDVTNYVWSG